MKKIIAETQKDFQSSCSKTPEYLAWHRLFKRDFKKFLAKFDISEIEISKPNHFDASGFFRLAGQAYYFRIEDLRWSKNHMLIRTAQSFKDYTSGSNRYANLKSDTIFENDFSAIIGKTSAEIA
jgi:hypothetical protein